MKNFSLKVMGVAIIISAVMTPLIILASDIVANLRTDASSVIDPKKLPMGNGYASGPKVGVIYPCLPDAFYRFEGQPSITGSW